MNEKMNERQSEESLSLIDEVSDEALEAAGRGSGLGGYPGFTVTVPHRGC